MGIFNVQRGADRHADDPSGSAAAADPPPAYVPSASSSTIIPFPTPYLATHTSHPAARPARPKSKHASILLSRTDRLRIIGFPNDIIASLDGVIKRAWKLGVQEQKAPDPLSWEWKLHGRPWTGQGIEGIASRRLIARIFGVLETKGWHLRLSADLSKSPSDKDTLIFRSDRSLQRAIFSISFNGDNKIRFIDAPGERVTQAVEQAIKDTWPPGIQEAQHTEPGVYQLKLRGNPWWASTAVDSSRVRVMACAILSAVEDEGCEMLRGLQMSVGAGDKAERDLDTWFFACDA
ncbi:uncharacterized protein MKK02DRAFT_39983 [Dioszegia hungarica]|uniref:Uncharacterized protein n=1 Tax=Dioszegia hungarica TaxID=4972 RepID=A0AA38LYW0_9TREE|nr:uncharacterized protein MKK02DRAFT_39983 [Dioszegia hungarica]KAI9639661.1 hypothetical protein MKK02DRAFT_39983 [Dioszegia hungarica]